MSGVFFGVESIIGPISQGRCTSKTALKKDAILPNKQADLSYIGNHKHLDPNKSCFKQQSNGLYTAVRDLAKV